MQFFEREQRAAFNNAVPTSFLLLVVALVSTVNCAEQIPESRASNLVSFAMFVRKVIVIQILKLMPESSN